MIMNKYLTLTAIAVAAISLSACNEKTETKTETKESTTMQDGTKVESKTETNIEVDQFGNRTGTVDTKTTVDPEGMMNKETTQERNEEVR